MPQKALGPIVGLLWAGTCLVVQGKEFCFGVNNEQYRCEMGYCCGETECCTYYYELWWFWLVWTLIIMLSCCCAYRHRRVKMRLQQEQRQREISLMAYQGASSSFIAPPPLNLRFWTDCKLPDYEEVVGHPPTPPPPYSELPPDAVPPAAPPAGQSEAAVVLEPPVRAMPCGQPAADSPGSAEGVVTPGEVGGAGGGGEEEEEEEEEEEQQLLTRRRHVTGDSGIEVCVCQLDADEGSGPEEEEEQDGPCQGPRGECCSQRPPDRHKQCPAQRRDPPPPTTSSSGDGLV
ncbi:WW domain-binding protein 1 isoform X1 [Conger conger]|uniref:WW domain-binding protein 1 isoform X1 n=2 Tax=Conger conger TaxID=82655 RepID=UPI002A59BACB|nr:WW domain-binding protein 1 isoform X1 [Conger conger]